MGAKENADLVRKAYRAFQEGDIVSFASTMDEEIVYHVAGRAALAGDKHGRAEVVDFFGQLASLTGGAVELEVQQVLANDDYGVGIHHLTATRAGQTVRTQVVIVGRVVDGVLVEVWEHPFKQYELDEMLGS